MTNTWQRLRSRTGDSGSLPFALMVTMMVVTITGFMMSLSAWQVQHQQAIQSDQESRWAAISALNLGIQKFQTVLSPAAIASRADIPTVNNSTSIPNTSRWMSTPNHATALRWWVETVPIDASRIILHGEGRSGGQVTSTASLTMTLVFDYSRAIWVPGSTIRPWEPAITNTAVNTAS